MNFTLIPEEAPSDSMRRIAAEQIEGAIAQVRRKDDLNDGIHEARKHFKRIRALLRLARGALPTETYISENQFYRDLGRLLSPHSGQCCPYRNHGSASKPLPRANDQRTFSATPGAHGRRSQGSS